MRSEILGTKFNKGIQNIPKEEKEALTTLIKLQRERKIIIKPCDKGAGIIICNFQDYVESSIDHLNSKVDASAQTGYYKEIKQTDLNLAKQEIDAVLKSVFNREEISKSELEAMLTKDKGPGKFYQIFKVHKKHTPPSLPPGRQSSVVVVL